MNMKKSLIAMAVAGVVAAPATAAAAEVYGRVNIAIQQTNEDAASATTNEGLGMQNISSRFGFQGEEDLGNGLTAQYRYEFATDPTNASISAGNRLGWIGLAGDFGQVKAGQMWTAYYNHVTVVTDPYWTGSANAYYGVVPGQLTSTRANDTLQYNNSTGPISFSVETQMDPTSQGGPPADTQDFDTMTFAGSYSAGGLTVGAGHYSASQPSGNEHSMTGFSGKFASGPWYVAGAYHMVDLDNGTEPSGVDLIAGMDFGGGLSADVTYGMQDTDTTGGQDTDTVSVQVQNALSDRTYLYGNLKNQSVDNATADSPQTFLVGAVHLF